MSRGVPRENKSVDPDTMLTTWRSIFVPNEIVEQHSVDVDLQRASLYDVPDICPIQGFEIERQVLKS